MSGAPNPEPDLPERARRALARLAPAARRVLVGVSGGADSVAALRALHAAGVPVAVGHLDHGLRAGSPDDAAFVRALAEALGVEAVEERVEVARVAEARGWNLEHAGRRVRYAFLTRAARRLGCDAVVTAHHLDDQAETVLAQLLRGSAHPVGIAPTRGAVVRPLLGETRASLRAYMEASGADWRADPDNQDVGRTRNWLRAVILPRLERRRPGTAARLARFGAWQRDDVRFLAEEARRRFGDGPLARRALASAPPALQRAALARLLRAAGVEASGEQLEALRAALAADGATRRDLPGGVRVVVDEARVHAVPAGDTTVAEAAAPVRVERPEALPPGLPAELLEAGPMELRPRRSGDWIRLPGGRKGVSDLLIDRKVPREDRDRLRVLARGDEVVWVEGVASAAGLPEAAADPDAAWMRRALALADAAAEAGETPVGAVVVREGRPLGEGRNRREARGDPAAHAEMEALRAAAAATGDWRLPGATLVVTLEPCPMCAGAALQAHVDRIVYGAANRRDGALGSVADLVAAPWKRRPSVRGGVLEPEARRRLERFFAERR